jgi:thiol:disulfide interchange protein
MKKLIFFLFICNAFISNSLSAQILNPIKWSFEAKKISDTEYDLVATAKIDKGWYTYSQFIGNDGPVPTSLTFDKSAQYQLVGKAEEVSDHKKSGFDKIFDMNITKFSDEVKFIQRVKTTGATEIKGKVNYQTCDDEKCLPPMDADFSYKIGAVSNNNGGGNGGAAAPVAPAGTPQYPSTIPAQTPQNQQVGVSPNNKSITQPPANTPTNAPITPANNGMKNPVKWAFESKKVSETEFDLIFKSTIEKGWHIYSPSMKAADLGPIPTNFTFAKSPNLEIVGKVKEESAHKRTHKEAVFDNMTVVDFEEAATFTQRVKVKDASQKVTGSVEYMACTDGSCLPPADVKFSFDLKNGVATEAIETTGLMPQVPTDVTTNAQVAENQTITDISQFKFDKTNETNDCTTVGTKATENETSLWLIFVLGFGGGLLALLTPCVFPMIPLTVSFFLKSSENRKVGIRNALVYALSIIILYVTMGILITTIFGSDALNRLSTNPIMNILFGVLFLVFAFSFFGYYEIVLPSSWTNKADEASNQGGLLGIFFMAATLALVSFSCTGPIIGTLLVQTATGSGGVSAGPTIGMLGFAVALALPFGLFALFPTMLKSLPKSGSWMDDVKVTLGFVEVALAFKFLSNADLIKGWKLLPYEAFLAIWILCALGLAGYHAGLFNFKYPRKIKSISLGRGAIVAVSLAFAAYLGLGFRYSEKSETFQTPELGSGILPPAGYSYIYPQKCPLNINCFHDLNEGIAYAKKVNKPILLDFTGWNCANCRKMEENVWNQTGVLELIRDKYVLVSLYTDDKTELHAPYQAYNSKFDGKLKDTEGEMWTDLEGTFFNKNSQPFYVLLQAEANNLRVLNAPTAYTPEVEKYKDFLKCGLANFR